MNYQFIQCKLWHKTCSPIYQQAKRKFVVTHAFHCKLLVPWVNEPKSWTDLPPLNAACNRRDISIHISSSHSTKWQSKWCSWGAWYHPSSFHLLVQLCSSFEVGYHIQRNEVIVTSLVNPERQGCIALSSTSNLSPYGRFWFTRHRGLESKQKSFCFGNACPLSFIEIWSKYTRWFGRKVLIHNQGTQPFLNVKCPTVTVH